MMERINGSAECRRIASKKPEGLDRSMQIALSMQALSGVGFNGNTVPGDRGGFFFRHAGTLPFLAKIAFKAVFPYDFEHEQQRLQS